MSFISIKLLRIFVHFDFQNVFNQEIGLGSMMLSWGSVGAETGNQEHNSGVLCKWQEFNH